MGGGLTFGIWICVECGSLNSEIYVICEGCGAVEGNGSSVSHSSSSRPVASVVQRERVEHVQEPYGGSTNRLGLQAGSEGGDLSRDRDSSSANIGSQLRPDQSVRHEGTLESTIKKCRRCKTRDYGS
jgi:hypothetical protein